MNYLTPLILILMRAVPKIKKALKVSSKVIQLDKRYIFSLNHEMLIVYEIDFKSNKENTAGEMTLLGHKNQLK